MLVSIFCLSNYSQSSANLLAGQCLFYHFEPRGRDPQHCCPELQQSANRVTLPPTAISEPQSFMCFYGLSQNAAGSETHHSHCAKLADPVSFCRYLLLHINTHTPNCPHTYTDKNTHSLPPLHWTDKHMMRSVKKNHEHFLLIIWITTLSLSPTHIQTQMNH